MTTHWISLCLGLLMGLIPPRLLINSECRYLIFEELWFRAFRRTREDGRRRRWWKLPLVWIDPVRGYVVAWMLSQTFEASPEGTSLEHLLTVALAGGLMLIAVWVQTNGRGAERETLSPSGFIAGMVLCLLPLQVSIAALVMGVAGAMALRGYVVGYLIATTTMAGVGFLFMGKSVVLFSATLLMAAPAIINWLRGSKMVIPVRC